MSIHKPRLNRAEEAAHMDCLRQLRAEGIDVEIPEELEERARRLDIIMASPPASTVGRVWGYDPAPQNQFGIRSARGRITKIRTD
jgi:hypothetical protein